MSTTHSVPKISVRGLRKSFGANQVLTGIDLSLAAHEVICLIGASGVLVNLGIFTALLPLGVNKFVASPIAIQCSIITNFLGNNYWTFRPRNLVGGIHARGLRFNVVSILSLAISYSTFVVLSHAFPRVAPQVHQFIGIIPATLVNYFLSSYWTFRDAKR